MIKSLFIALAVALALGTTACAEEETGTEAAALATGPWDFYTKAQIDEREADACPNKADPFCEGIVPAAREAWEVVSDECSGWSDGVCVDAVNFPSVTTTEPLTVECWTSGNLDTTNCTCRWMSNGSSLALPWGAWHDKGCDGTGSWVNGSWGCGTKYTCCDIGLPGCG